METKQKTKTTHLAWQRGKEQPGWLTGKLLVTKLLAVINAEKPWPWLSMCRVLKRQHLIRYRSWDFLAELNMKSPWQPFFQGDLSQVATAGMS